jgi:putative Mn2+ efflux pump MntP
VPLLPIFYLFFQTVQTLAGLATPIAAAIIFVLGAHFFYEGFTARNEKDGFGEEEKEKSK